MIPALKTSFGFVLLRTFPDGANGAFVGDEIGVDLGQRRKNERAHR